ncbi:hypothetical protein D3C84_990410 [compost metagenome]
MRVLTSKALPPPLFSMAVASRRRSLASIPLTLPLTALISVMLPLKGMPVPPGGFQLPVVPVTVPWLVDTTPWLMLRTGSATEAIRVTSSVVCRTLLSKVRVWLDSPSTLKARWSANGWSLTVRVKSMAMRLPLTPVLT